MSRRLNQDSDSYYLPTGWRIVGRGAEQIAEQVTASSPAQLSPGTRDNTLYALQCTFDRVVKGRPVVERLLDAITDEIRLSWLECPRLTRDRELKRPPSRYGGLLYNVTASPGTEWIGEIIWRSVHPTVTGAPITSHVLLEERASYTRLNLRVTPDDGIGSVRGYVGAGQAQPAFLKSIRSDLTPMWLGGPLRAHLLAEGGIEDFVENVLSSEERQVPVVVISPFEEGGYAVDVDELLWDLFGRARLYVIAQHQQTFALTDAVGDRRMSCFWGAARAYLPGWSRHDDPYAHPLLVGDRLADPVMRAAWYGELGIWLGSRTTLPARLEERRSQAAPEVSDDGWRQPGESIDPRRNAETLPAVLSEPSVSATVVSGGQKSASKDLVGQPPERLGAHEPRSMPREPVDSERLLEAMLQGFRDLRVVIEGLADEVDRLRTVAAVRSAGANALERRLGRVEEYLERVVSEVLLASNGNVADPAHQLDLSQEADAAADEEEQTLVDVVKAMAESTTDALVFLDSAYESAMDSPYEDPERVRAVLDAMARVARRRQDGVLRASLKEAFNDLGIDYRAAIARTTPARLRQQYRFRYRGDEIVAAEEHIVLGNTYNPRRCLRIYFSSRVPNEPRFVIGHVGRHLTVMSST